MGTGILILLTRINQSYTRRLDMDEYALHLEQNVQKSRDLLNKMVADTLVEWSIYNVRAENESYINDERRDKCIEWIISRVIENSTPAIIEQVGIGYPAETQEQYINSIKNVAIIHVMDFTVKQNVKDMEDNIPNINISGDF